MTSWTIVTCEKVELPVQPVLRDPGRSAQYISLCCPKICSYCEENIKKKKKMEHYENIGTKEEEKKTRAASKEV